MNRTETYSGTKERQKSGTRSVGEVDTLVGNGLAVILAALAVGAGVIGLLVAFAYVNDDAANPFQDGMIWMISGIILAIAANVFRREHHVVDPYKKVERQPLAGGSESRGYDKTSFDEEHDEIGSRSAGTPQDVRTRSQNTRDDLMRRSGDVEDTHEGRNR